MNQMPQYDKRSAAKNLDEFLKQHTKGGYGITDTVKPMYV